MKRLFPIIVLLACVAAFVFGVIRLFQLRFEVGDVYPAYSSLRSDPLGTMAFYESLEQLPGVTVRRDYSQSNELPEGEGTAYLHLAGNFDEWTWFTEDDFEQINRFLAHGGRLVITLFPEPAGAPYPRHHDDKNTGPSPKEDRPRDENDRNAQKDSPETEPGNPEKKTMRKIRKEPETKVISIRDRWGVDVDAVALKPDDNGVYQPVRVVNQTDLPLPQKLDWHSGLVFYHLDHAWRTIYTRGADPVMIERSFRGGSVVLATDSYFVSNEAMTKDRHADLLAWLIGANRNIVFDEAHLGVVETSGVATLMRKYRLHGLAAGLILLAGLFIWKNSLSLVPPHAEAERQEYVAGKDSAAGFVNLLRRSIAPRDLLGTCYVEWKKSVAPTGKYSTARRQQAELAFQTEISRPPRDRNPIETYKNICSILGTHNSQTKS